MIDHLNSFFFKISIYETYYFSRERGFDWHILSGLWVFYAGFFASPYTQIFYPDFESFTKGFYPHPRVSASPIIQIFYPDFESFMPGFLLHHTLRYFIPTLSLLRRVFCFTIHSDILSRLWVFYAGCLVSPYSQIFYPDFESFTPGAWSHPTVWFYTPHISGVFGVSLLWMGAWSHPTVRFFILTLSLLRRVPGLTLQSDILSGLCVFYAGFFSSPYTQIYYPDFESFTKGAWSHPTVWFYTPHISGVFRVSLLRMGARSHTHHSHILSGLWVFYAAKCLLPSISAV